VPAKKIKKKDQEGQEAHAKEQEQAGIRAEEAVARLHAAIAEGRSDTVKQELRAAGTIKENEKLPRRVRVSLTWCKGCQEGRISTTLVTGDVQAQQEVKLAEAPVPATFVGGMLADEPKAV
jgi:hypothetical protein